MAKAKTYLDNVGLKMSTKDYRYWEAMQQKVGGFIPTTKTEHVGLGALLDEIDKRQPQKDQPIAED